MRVAAQHGRPFVARGSGTGLAGGATPLGDPVVIVTTQMNRVLEVDPVAARRVGRARRPQPRSLPRRARTSGCTTPPIRRRSRRARSAATSPPTPAARTASRRASRRRTSSRSRSCSPTGQVDRARRTRARRARLRPARAASSAREGTMGIATRVAVRLTPNPPAVATHAAATSARSTTPRRTVSGIIAAGIVARRARDDGRRRSPARSRTSSARAIRATPQRCCSSRSTGSPAASPHRSRRSATIARAHGARVVRVAADDAERALLWKGRKSAFGAIARIAPDYYLHDAVVPRTRARRGAAARVRDRRRARPHDDERLPRRRRQPASAHRVRPPRAGHLGAGARRRQRDPADVHRRPAACSPGEHGVGHREARSDAADVLGPTISMRRRACATRSTPTVPRNPRQGAAARAAGAASCSGCRRARGSDRDAAGRRGRRCGDVAARRRRRAGRAPARTGRSADPAARPASRSRHRRASSRYDPADLTVTVGAGTTVAELDAVLAEHGQECPLDPRDRARDRRRRARDRAVGHPPAPARARARTGARGALRHRRRPRASRAAGRR